ncbi:MAG: terpene cyclase/mutase family protein [Planctomycetes bacterium]|nr:terpene cyclase/mutase family protein [Planctomycetota bacterium]
MVNQPHLDPTRIHVESHLERPWEHQESFSDVMAEQLKHAPYLGIAILVHAVVLLILWQIKIVHKDKPEPVAMNMQQQEVIEEPEEEEIEEPEPIEEPVETEPVIEDSEVTEEETVDDTFEEEQMVDSAFESDNLNDVIGIGGGAGGKFGGRGGGRGRLGKGGRPTAQAIQMGLEWLKDHQDDDGKWDADEFMKHDPPSDLCDGQGNPVNDIGLTGLALLAFLGDGSTMRAGPYKDVVKKGIIWLKDQQEESGALGPDSHRAHIYNHAIATLALVEAYGLSKYTTLKRYAQRAVDYICKFRNPYKVWRYYARDGANDTSVTGWMVFVLKSSIDFKLTVDHDALKYSEAWFEEVTDPSTGQCGYTKRGEGSSRELGMGEKFPAQKTEALTAVGLLCRIFLGQTPQDNPILNVAADTMLKKPPVWNENDGSIDVYYWYYGSYAMFQMGGRHWTGWKKSLEPALIKPQRKEGSAKGSWDPIGAWGHDGGRVYSTAIGVLCLEVYYRYSRLIR